MNVGLLNTIEGSYQCANNLAGTALEIDEKHQQVNNFIEDVLIRDASRLICEATIAHTNEDL